MVNTARKPAGILGIWALLSIASYSFLAKLC